MNLLNELRINLRLRIGLALIIAIFGFYGLLEWRDRSQASLAEYRQISGQIARLGNRDAQALWLSRADESGKALLAAQKRLWRNVSFGQSQAEFQDWLYSQLRQVDAKNFSVRLTDADASLNSARATMDLPAELSGLKQLRARIEFNNDPNVLLGLLAAFGDAPHQVIVDTLIVKAQRVELGLNVWFDLSPPVVAASPTPASSPARGMSPPP